MKLRFLAPAALALLVSSGPAAHAESFHAGIHISDETSADETGLPAYPGATIVEKRNGNNDSARVQIGFGDYGLKLVVIKMRTTDSIDKISDFYRKELAQYGEVLDCSGPRDPDRKRDRKSKKLSCDDVRLGDHEIVFKAGVKNDQHLVEIKTRGDKVEFALAHVRVKGFDWWD